MDLGTHSHHSTLPTVSESLHQEVLGAARTPCKGVCRLSALWFLPREPVRAMPVGKGREALDCVVQADGGSHPQAWGPLQGPGLSTKVARRDSLSRQRGGGATTKDPPAKTATSLCTQKKPSDGRFDMEEKLVWGKRGKESSTCQAVTTWDLWTPGPRTKSSRTCSPSGLPRPWPLSSNSLSPLCS